MRRPGWKTTKTEFRQKIMIEGFDAAKAIDRTILIGGNGGSTLGGSGSPATNVDGWLTYDEGSREALVRDFDFFSVGKDICEIAAFHAGKEKSAALLELHEQGCPHRFSEYDWRLNDANAE